MLSKKKGFTLIELMVVIAIITALAAVITPQVFRQVAKGRVAAAIRFYNSIKTAANAYFADTGGWPVSTTNFTTAGGVAGWNGPYIEKWPAAGHWANSFYGWMSSANGTVFNATAAGERWLGIMGSGIKVNDRNELDIAIDGALSNTTGACHHDTVSPCNATMVCIAVSRDGPID